MSAAPPSVSALLRAHALLLRALPAPFRARHGDEIAATAREVVFATLAAAGPAAACRRAAHELLDLGGVALRLRLPARRPEHRLATTPPDAGDPTMTGLLHDLRHAARALLRRPGYALAAMGTLALGVGAATAVGSVVHTVLVRALPFPDADRLVMVWRTAPTRGMDRAPTSVPDYLDWQRDARSFTDLAVYTNGASGTLLAGAEPRRITGASVSGNLFRTLGVRAVIGRTILDVDAAPGAEPAIVLSDLLWRRTFGADPGIVGQVVDLGEQRARVVGVMPPDFSFPSARAEFWAPLHLDPAENGRDLNFLTTIGRLRDGVTVEGAQAEVAAINARILASGPPDGNFGSGISVERRQDFVVRDVRPVLVVLLGGALLLLGIACANLANLMLVRATARARELAIRSALGAGRAQLLRSLVAEGAVLGVGGALLGGGLAWGAMRAFLVLGPGALPRRDEIALDARALALSAALAVACALACAAIPAWRATRRQVGGMLRDGTRATTGRATGRLQGGLVVVQLALALVLLVGAGLLGHSLLRLMGVPTGFDTRPVLTAKLSLPESRYGETAQVHAFYDALFDRLAALPGVTAVGGTWALPFGEDWGSSTKLPTDGVRSWDDAASIALAPVRRDYFDALGMRIVKGSNFTGRETPDAPLVTIINETLARRYWPGQDPIGRQLRGRDADASTFTVVGVVADAKRRALDAETDPEMYLPHGQTPWSGGDLYVTVRTGGDPLALASSLREAVWALDPRLPVTNLAPLDDVVAESLAAPRFRTVVVATLATIAGLLALVGVYGVLAFVVSMRTRELAVRVALGASRRQMLGGVLGRGLRLTGLGVALGLAGALAASRLLGSMLYGVTPLDAPTYAGVCALLVGAALLACWVPARRAAGVDPMVALREE